MFVFAFKGTSSPHSNTHFIDSSEEAIDKLLEELIKLQPDKILGLGKYSGKDQAQVRIEIICTNKFRNKILGDQLIQLPIPYFLEPNKNMKLASGIGNSWCNLVSYKIVLAINSGKIKSKYTFLHIPKGMR